MCADVPKYIFIVEINVDNSHSAVHQRSNKKGCTKHRYPSNWRLSSTGMQQAMTAGREINIHSQTLWNTFWGKEERAGI